jgi:hypothetical protein
MTDDRLGEFDDKEFVDQAFREKLRSAVPPFHDTEPRRDLWPPMLQRLEEPRPLVLWRVPWFDWVLLAVSAAAAIFFPALIPALVYHL